VNAKEAEQMLVKATVEHTRRMQESAFKHHERLQAIEIEAAELKARNLREHEPALVSAAVEHSRRTQEAQAQHQKRIHALEINAAELRVQREQELLEYTRDAIAKGRVDALLNGIRS